MVKFQGYAEQGGEFVVTSGVSSTTQVQQSYPSASVSVFYTGGASGTVSTSGTAVTWVTGTKFNANSGWPGLSITINSVSYVIASVASGTSLTLTSSAGTQTGVSYSMPATAPAAIFSDNAGTVLANPFSASANGYWFFYAATGTYDVKLSGGGIPSPVTWGAVSGVDPSTVILSGSSPSFNNLTVTGNETVGGNLTVDGTLTVDGNASLDGVNTFTTSSASATLTVANTGAGLGVHITGTSAGTLSIDTVSSTYMLLGGINTWTADAGLVTSFVTISTTNTGAGSTTTGASLTCGSASYNPTAVFTNSGSGLCLFAKGTYGISGQSTGTGYPAAGIIGTGTAAVGVLGQDTSSGYGGYFTSISGAGIYATSSSGLAGQFVGPIQASSVNYIAVENGANSAIASAAGSGPALVAGLVVVVKLAHTLQAGSNTFAYNGGSAVAIKSSFNSSNNISTAYAATGFIQMVYNGSVWLDLKQ